MASEGGAFVGSGSVAALASSFLEDGQQAYVALRLDGTIVYASGSIRNVANWDPEDLVGANALDFLHPEDAERAVLQLTELTVVGSTPGPAVFRMRRPDGSWLPIETLGDMVSDGAEQLVGIWVRSAEYHLFLEDLLANMVSGVPRLELMRSVCNSIDWHLFGSSVGIAWGTEGSMEQVSTGLADRLGGADIGPGTPWDLARTTGRPEQGLASDLDAIRQQLARDAGLGAYWVEPVHWDPVQPPATITVWTAEGPRAPGIHAYGVGVAKGLVEIVLRWTGQAERLDQAAHSDSLTGLLNHRAFFGALARSSRGGAVLYCDLDHFKPVNDDLGHTAGDALLRVAARRIEGCVRDEDVVARLGGDEFAVLCAGVGEREAEEIANRILEALKEPVRLEEVGRDVRIDASIGVAVSSSPISEDLLQAADRALGAAKSAGRGRVSLDGGR